MWVKRFGLLDGLVVKLPKVPGSDVPISLPVIPALKCPAPALAAVVDPEETVIIGETKPLPAANS
jgi:hypothetical protein